MISHTNNINRNVAALLNKYSEKEAVEMSGLKYGDIVALCRTDGETRLKRLERFALGLGTTVAELTLMPGIETDWHKECHSDFIKTNLRSIRVENNLGVTDVAVEIDCETAKNIAQKIWNYESGQSLPPLGMLQKLADVYEIEVADLMLPIELKEEP